MDVYDTQGNHKKKKELPGRGTKNNGKTKIERVENKGEENKRKIEKGMREKVGSNSAGQRG